MAITSESITRDGNVVIVTATSGLTPPVYFFFYVDGAFVLRTTTGRMTIVLEPGEQVRIDVLDSTDADFDALANAPDGYPSRKTLVWNRTPDAVAHYRVEQQRESEGYETLARIYVVDATWQFTHVTARLDDLTQYDWRVVPVDANGEDGTPVAIGPETIVRTPDAPEFSVTATATGSGAKIEFADAA